MNLFHLPAILFLILSVSGLQTNNQMPSFQNSLITEDVHFAAERLKEEDAEFIPWTNRRILTWEDFQAIPQTNTDAVASTSTSLGISYMIRDGVLDYEVTCNFSKTKSWGYVKTPYILAHEQAHFDITEIFARKLHKELSEYQLDSKNYRQDVTRIYQAIVDQKEAFQKAYDGQTDHSRNRRQQEEWLNKINTILEETTEYAIYP